MADLYLSMDQDIGQLLENATTAAFRVFVTKVPVEINKDGLSNIFGKCGQVIDVSIPVVSTLLRQKFEFQSIFVLGSECRFTVQDCIRHFSHPKRGPRSRRKHYQPTTLLHGGQPCLHTRRKGSS